MTRKLLTRGLAAAVALGYVIVFASALAEGQSQFAQRDEGRISFDADLGSLSRLSLALPADSGAGGSAGEEDEAVEELDFGDDATGTDPRGFGSKLMPYFRYTELKNKLKVQELVLFGMWAFNPNFAMTYEFPIAKRIDYSSVREFKQAEGIDPGEGAPGVPSGGIPFDDLAPDGDETGIGDLNLRFFHKFEQLRRDLTEEDSLEVMPIIETTLPTATEDVLGNQAWLLSPGFALVTDIPGPPPLGLGFFAMMNFFDFDLFKDDSVNYTERFRGRWFWMQPLTKPEGQWWGGFYLLTEFQPVYDFRADDFSFWMGPEFGKIIRDGFIIYGKPGWTFDPDRQDREFTFETGFRYFF